MSHAHTFDIETVFPDIATQFDTDSGSAIPVANILEILGNTVSNATFAEPVFTTGAGNTVTVNVQVGAAITGAPADQFDAGIVSFDDTQFTVDPNGYVQLIGGGMAMDTLTGDAGGAVGPDGDGNIDWNGVTVANAANAKPVFVQGTPGSNLLEIDVQVGAAITGAPGDTNDAGLSSYNDTQFTVDVDGYVELVGGTDLPAIQTLTSDDPTAVGPDASGNIDITGEAVANATNAKPIFVDAGSNALNIEVQVATEIASAPGDKNDAGIVSFNAAQFTVDTDGFTQLVSPFGPSVGVINLGFTLSSGTFSVTSADGSALSATNPGYVTIWSREATNPGTIITIPITANQSFDDATAAGGSEITGNLFGTTTGVAFAERMPFAVNAVLNDAEDTIQFMLTRNIFGMTSAAAADIGAPDDAVADAQSDYWSFDNIDETLYNGNPAMTIGIIYMTKDTSDDWTVQGLFASGSGSNYPRVFTVEALANWFRSEEAHFGAATGSFMIDNGGTAPTFTTQYVRYQYAGPQTMRNQIYLTGNTATDGAGAVTAQIAIPYSVATNAAAETAIIGSGYVTCPGYTGIVVFEGSTNNTYVEMRDINGTKLANQDFSDGGRTITGTLIFRTGVNN